MASRGMFGTDNLRHYIRLSNYLLPASILLMESCRIRILPLGNVIYSNQPRFTQRYIEYLDILKSLAARFTVSNS